MDQEQPSPARLDPDPGPEDYSYDLAHEVPTGSAPPGQRPGRAGGPAAAATAAVDPDGDYSYDLAHEIPPQRPVG